MKKVLLASSLCCLFSSAILAAPHWAYQGDAGPEQWAKLTPEFGQCAGSNQSPVDLMGMVDAKLVPLVLREFNFEVRHSPMPPDGTLRIP